MCIIQSNDSVSHAHYLFTQWALLVMFIFFQILLVCSKLNKAFLLLPACSGHCTEWAAAKQSFSVIFIQSLYTTTRNMLHKIHESTSYRSHFLWSSKSVDISVLQVYLPPPIPSPQSLLEGQTILSRWDSTTITEGTLKDIPLGISLLFLMSSRDDCCTGLFSELFFLFGARSVCSYHTIGNRSEGLRELPEKNLE